jgi:transcription-repair coupling factor (superfamily II helicase)
MGAGFSIAMRDLELRGAGNILGTQQSGHIATVGYELYCDLLEKAVRKLKKLPPKQSLDVSIDLPGQAYIPRDYVPDVRLKIDLYRRVARIAGQQELDELAAELIDRFGARPVEVERMLLLAQLRIWSHHWLIASIHLEDTFVVFRYTRRKRIEELQSKSGGKLRIVDDQSAYLPMGQAIKDSAATLDAIKSLLQPAGGAPIIPPRASRR